MKSFIRIPTGIRIDKLHNVAESTLEITANIAVLDTQRQGVEASLDLFKAGKEKTNVIMDRGKLDKNRDNILGALYHQIRADLQFPWENQDVKQVVSLSNDVWNTHGKGIWSLPYDEESAALGSLNNAMEGLDQELLAQTGVSRWLPLLKQANEEFKNYSLEKISIINQEDQTLAAGNFAPDLIKALNELYKYLYAQIVVNPTDELVKAYQECELLID